MNSNDEFNDDDERVPIEQRKRPPESFTSKNNILSISEDITAKQSTSFGNRYPLSSHEGETIESNNKSSLVSSQRYKDYIDRIAGRQIIAEGDQYRDEMGWFQETRQFTNIIRIGNNHTLTMTHSSG